MNVHERLSSNFHSGFRDWEGGKRVITVPVNAVDRAKTISERFKSGYEDIFQKMLGKLTVNPDQLPPQLTRATWFPVRLWIHPKDLHVSRDELLALWAERGYRPLTFHEAIDLETAFESDAIREKDRIGLYPRAFLGVEAGYRRGDEADPDPVIIQLYRQALVAARSCRALRFSLAEFFPEDDVLHPLTFDLSDEERATFADVPLDAPALYPVPDRLRSPSF